MIWLKNPLNSSTVLWSNAVSIVLRSDSLPWYRSWFIMVRSLIFTVSIGKKLGVMLFGGLYVSLNSMFQYYPVHGLNYYRLIFSTHTNTSYMYKTCVQFISKFTLWWDSQCNNIINLLTILIITWSS